MLYIGNNFIKDQCQYVFVDRACWHQTYLSDEKTKLGDIFNKTLSLPFHYYMFGDFDHLLKMVLHS